VSVDWHSVLLKQLVVMTRLITSAVHHKPMVSTDAAS